MTETKVKPQILIVTADELADILGARKMSTGSWQARSPLRRDANPSLTISEGKDGTCLLHDHGDPDNQEGLLEILREKYGVIPYTASHHGELAANDTIRPIRSFQTYTEEEIEITKRIEGGVLNGVYHYMDLSGTRILLTVARYRATRNSPKGISKTIRPFYMKDEKTICRWPEYRPLYNLHHLNDDKAAPVIVVEGEKTAEAGTELFGKDHIVTTWPCGCNGVKQAQWSALEGRDVIIIPDADAQGKNAARKIAEILTNGIAKSVRIVELPDNLPTGWDIADTFPDTFSKDGLRSLINDAPLHRLEYTAHQRNIRSLGSVITQEYRPVNWCVQNLIAEGVTILAGKPKVGKSWLCLQLCAAVSGGTTFLGRNTQQGAVLYLALEDTDRRLKDRATALGINPDQPIDVETRWSALDEKGVQEMENWIQSKNNPRLIIIDTLAKVRPPINSNKSLYEQDYNALAKVKEMAEQYNVAVVVIHHKSKRTADDQLDEMSGTTGLGGGADSVLTLSPKKNCHRHAVLYGRGRDLPHDVKMLMRHDENTGAWALVNEDYDDDHDPTAAQRILAALEGADGALSYDMLEAMTGINKSTIRSAMDGLSSMVERTTDNRRAFFRLRDEMNMVPAGDNTSAAASEVSPETTEPLDDGWDD